jgi:hypothetical protein
MLFPLSFQCRAGAEHSEAVRRFKQGHKGGGEEHQEGQQNGKRQEVTLGCDEEQMDH